MDPCVICSELSKNRCSNCNQSSYCCEEHQKKDWKHHKKNCYPFKIVSDDILGRHLIATRKIKPFEVIIKEAPLIEGPQQITPPVCLGCLNGIEPNDYIDCENCGWPLCGIECNNKEQHKPECMVTASRGRKVKIQDFTNPHPLYHSLTTLRCLLLQKTNIENWNKLNELESLEITRRGSAQWKADLESIGKFIPKFFNTNEYDEDLIMKTVGILQINGHEVPNTDPLHVAVYHKASFLEHSCLPNLAKSFTKDGNLVLWAPDGIKKGQHLSICYSDAIWGTADRQRHLMPTKLFKCNCIRCSDVTELNTFYSGLKCTDESCQGSMVPFNSQDWLDVWRCRECHKEVKREYVDKILEKVGKDFQAMEKTEDNLLKFIKHYEKWLSRNHYNLCEAKIQLVLNIGKGNRELMTVSDDYLALKLQYGKELIELYEKIGKCETRLLGTLCFELHSAVAENTRRVALLSNLSPKNLLEESLFYVEKACNYLQYENEMFTEGQIYKQAKINRDALKLVIIM